MPQAINDGLTKTQRYRLKDVEAYRQMKRDYAKTPDERAKRTAYMRKWRAENRSKFNEQARQSRERNKHKHVEKNKDRHLVRKYGVAMGEYKIMLAAQGGKCAFCGKPAGSRRLHVDHDHATGAVRKLLCGPCNGALGWYELYREKVALYLGESIGIPYTPTFNTPMLEDDDEN